MYTALNTILYFSDYKKKEDSRKKLTEKRNKGKEKKSDHWKTKREKKKNINKNKRPNNTKWKISMFKSQLHIVFMLSQTRHFKFMNVRELKFK